MSSMKIIECPRDAMQGLHDFIGTDDKVRYINQLLKVGYDTIDFGSFVSPKAIPQMRDTAEVLGRLDDKGNTKLLAIIANARGAQDACSFDEVDYLGFPFSISEEFQKRNTNSTIAESLGRVEEIQDLCAQHNKQLVIYISMGFGNPYGEEWSPELAAGWAERLHKDIGVNIISLADTIGVSNPENITGLFEHLIPTLPKVEFGAHLHSHPATRNEKIEAAWNAGCRRIDSAIQGLGGCPMADDDLVGNMATENLLEFSTRNEIETGLNLNELSKAQQIASEIFPS